MRAARKGRCDPLQPGFAEKDRWNLGLNLRETKNTARRSLLSQRLPPAAQATSQLVGSAKRPAPLAEPLRQQPVRPPQPRTRWCVSHNVHHRPRFTRDAPNRSTVEGESRGRQRGETKAAAKGGLTFGERALRNTPGGNGAKVMEHVALVALCQSISLACRDPK